LKEEDIKLAKLYLRKAKRNVKVGNIVSTVTVSISAVGAALFWKYFKGDALNQVPILYMGNGLLFGAGKVVGISYRINAKKNIELAKELVNTH
jgi:hypothetical protein